MSDIQNNLYHIRNEIDRLAIENGRKPEDLRLVAVSKSQSTDSIYSAYQAGQRDFGENYVQESVAKIKELKAKPADEKNPVKHDFVWHFIGQIQGNKCKLIAKHFNWVHSLCKLSHAQRLNDSRPDNMTPIQACIQINLEPGTQRGGIAVDSIKTLLQQTAGLERLHVRGLMCVLPTSLHGDSALQGFKRVHSLFKDHQLQFPQLDTLSMGMSGDFTQAIQAGATILRLGTAIFGPRTANK